MLPLLHPTSKTVAMMQHAMTPPQTSQSDKNGGGGQRVEVGKHYRRAGLDEKLAHGRAVVHCVEGGDLVDAHGGHLEQAGDLVHDADAGEAVLPLAEVKQRQDGRLLILGRIPLEDLGDDGLVGRCEIERDVGVVVGGVPVLCAANASANCGFDILTDPIEAEYSPP